MDLLQANVSLLIPIDKNIKAKDSENLKTDVNVNILANNALVPSVSPMSSSYGGVGSGDFAFDQVSVYVVRNGDTLAQVASMFDVSVDTILSANDMKKGDKLKEGDVLLILPFSGVEHTVTKGQTLKGIANLYKVDVEEIVSFNDIDSDSKLIVGDKLIIPGADLLKETTPKSTNSKSIAKGAPYQASVKNADGYFVNPVPNGKKTRGTSSGHKGVDLAAPVGTPIYASASGTVNFARTGYNGGFGNLVIISHSNGTKTLYAHMSKIGTSIGARVTQGEVIGYVGSTGRSTGPHLHFEVQGAKNPGNSWSWKY